MTFWDDQIHLPVSLGCRLAMIMVPVIAGVALPEVRVQCVFVKVDVHQILHHRRTLWLLASAARY